MKAEIISIGTEILLGEITDSNAAYLASQLPSLGIELLWVSQVGDDLPRMLEVFNRAWQRSDLILATGGLGPTDDDLTRNAIAQMLGEKMSVDPALEAALRQRFGRLGTEMPASNLRQAMLIPSAKAIPNPFGTAPGWWVEKNGRQLTAMPGPPREMQPMWQNEIKPKLRPQSKEIILTRTFKTFGLGEAAAGEMVSDLFSSPNPILGIYARPDGIQLRLAAKATDVAQAEALATKMEMTIRERLGNYIWGTDDDTTESVVVRLFYQKKLTVGVIEDYTAGLMSAALADMPGFKGGIVTCSPEGKLAAGLKSLADGASPAAATEMAETARKLFRADIGIGISAMKPSEGPATGTVYLELTGHEPQSVSVRLGRHRVVTTALFELRKILL